MRLERLLGYIIMLAGVVSLLWGIFSAMGLMTLLIPMPEIATNQQLAAFFYASTPQAIMWSIAFATFFASGIFLVKTASTECNDEINGGSQPEFSVDRLIKADSRNQGETPRNSAEERIQSLKADVLKAIARLEELDRKKE